ncbi:hypothetical protein E2C01_091590 [Portunus trituberculatus]|uniref:Uncharacterized protein n=1 Tax=Portunus trituberculatus TaxID=210409 RepID=A0A5B7JP05_PORTR|nr:hypothetical protein [Portunus trituberculatus]
MTQLSSYTGHYSSARNKITRSEETEAEAKAEEEEEEEVWDGQPCIFLLHLANLILSSYTCSLHIVPRAAGTGTLERHSPLTPLPSPITSCHFNEAHDLTWDEAVIVWGRGVVRGDGGVSVRIGDMVSWRQLYTALP